MALQEPRVLKEIRIVRQNLRRDSYLNAGPLKVAIAGEKMKRSGQMNLSKIRSKAQGLIYGRVTQGASLWRGIDPIKVEIVVSVRDHAIREREFTILLGRFFQ